MRIAGRGEPPAFSWVYSSMETITYVLHMTREDGVTPRDITVDVTIPRPDGWADATHHERTMLFKRASTFGGYESHPGAVEMLALGYFLTDVTDPVCECVVQNVPERDPLLCYTNNTCCRCGGPLP